MLPDPRRKEGLVGPGRQWACDTPQAFTESSHSEGEHPRTPSPATSRPPCPERGCFSWRGLGLPLVAQPTPQILLERTLGRVGSWVGGPRPGPSSAPKSGDWKEQGLYVGAAAPSWGAGPAEPSASRSGLPRGLSGRAGGGPTQRRKSVRIGFTFGRLQSATHTRPPARSPVAGDQRLTPATRHRFNVEVLSLKI